LFNLLQSTDNNTVITDKESLTVSTLKNHKLGVDDEVKVVSPTQPESLREGAKTLDDKMDLDSKDLHDLPRQVFTYAIKLYKKTLEEFLNCDMSPYFFPSMHCELVFLYDLTFSRRRSELESHVPWSKLVNYLNSLIELKSSSGATSLQLESAHPEQISSLPGRYVKLGANGSPLPTSLSSSTSSEHIKQEDLTELIPSNQPFRQEPYLERLSTTPGTPRPQDSIDKLYQPHPPESKESSVLLNPRSMIPKVTKAKPEPNNSSSHSFTSWEPIGIEEINKLVQPAQLFPRPASGPTNPLPEDYVLRGLIWTTHYYPKEYFSQANLDLEERTIEPPSNNTTRMERIIWLGAKIAQRSSKIRLDLETTRFVTIT
jgi:hypothetical protein